LFDVVVEGKGGYIDSDNRKGRNYVGFCTEIASVTIPVRRGVFHKRHDPLVGDGSESLPIRYSARRSFF
jgi:hypothetical protein